MKSPTGFAAMCRRLHRRWAASICGSSASRSPSDATLGWRRHAAGRLDHARRAVAADGEFRSELRVLAAESRRAADSPPATAKRLSVCRFGSFSGQWKPERLDRAWPSASQANRAMLPEQLPDRVEFVLGRTEDVLPLFPYRMTYWRTPAPHNDKSQEPLVAARAVDAGVVQCLAKTIDAREFQYQPGDQEVQNLTQFYVQRYSGETKLR